MAAVGPIRWGGGPAVALCLGQEAGRGRVEEGCNASEGRHAHVHPLLVLGRDRSLVLLFVAGFLVKSNLFVALTILPVYAADFGAPPWVAGVHTGIFTGAAIFMRLYFGPLADRRGRKLNLYLGTFVFASAWALALIGTDPVFLGFVRAYQAIGLATYLASATSLIADRAPDRLRGTALGIDRMFSGLAATIAPAAGLAVRQAWGYPTLFSGTALIVVVAMALVAMVREDRRRLTVTRQATARIRDLLWLPPIPAALAAVVGLVLAHGNMFGFLPLYADAAGIAGLGYWFMAAAVTSIPGGGLGGWLSDHYGRRTVLLPAVGLCGLAMLMLAPLALVGPSLALALLIGSGLLTGLAWSAGLAAGVTLVADRAGQVRRATALSLYESTIDGTLSLGAVAFGLLVTGAGYATAFLTTAAVILVLVGGLVLAGSRLGWQQAATRAD